MSKIEIVTIIGSPEEFYRKISEYRATKKILEEFISQQAVQVEQPKLVGIRSLQPEFGIIVTAILIVQEPDEIKTA